MANPAHHYPHPHSQSCSSKQGREGPLSCEPPQQRERVQSQSGRGPRGVNNKHAGAPPHFFLAEICHHFCLLDSCPESLFKSLGLILIASQQPTRWCGTNNVSKEESCDHFCLLDSCHNYLVVYVTRFLSKSSVALVYFFPLLKRCIISFSIASHLGLGGRY